MPIEARTLWHRFGSYSRPAAVGCSDGQRWVAKCPQTDRNISRAIFNDHVVGRLGMLIAAPVQPLALVEFPAALIAIEPQFSTFVPGVAHACLWLDSMTDRLTLQYAHVPDNRPRVARIAVLYSWAGVWTDHQLIYTTVPPNLVYTVDHGHFFPGGPDWTRASLSAAPSPAVFDGWFTPCNLTAQELRPAWDALGTITDTDIAAAVGTPPDAWGVTVEERVEIADYLARRRADLLAAL